jgi:hypothetical protein
MTLGLYRTVEKKRKGKRDFIKDIPKVMLYTRTII